MNTDTVRWRDRVQGQRMSGKEGNREETLQIIML